MKKNQRLLLLLLGVLLICCAVYGLLRLVGARRAERAEDDASGGVIYLCQLEDAVSITYQTGAELLSLTLDGGVWSCDADPDFPLSQSDVGLLASSLKNLAAIRRLDGGEELSSYGLSSPAGYVSAKNAAGDEMTIFIGNAASDGSYYAMRDGDDAVYTISSTLPQQLKGLYDLYSLPSIHYAGCTVDSVELSGAMAGQSRTLTGLASNESDEADALRSAWSAMAFESLYVYQPDASQLSDCGFDTPALSVKLTYSEGAVSHLMIGGVNESGGYYARLGADGDICILPEDQVSALLSALAAL